MSDLERAIALATAAHAGKGDKAGAPYILHPLRLMLRMTTNEERIAAVLHDEVEDTPFSLDELLRLGFGAAVVEAVEARTKRPDEHGTDEGYLRFVQRAGRHPVGRAVKVADIQDNMDLSRIPEPKAQDHARIARYRRALDLIRSMQAISAPA
jgi:(p)ppGpp synthase/HD superfamily hydrolase